MAIKTKKELEAALKKDREKTPYLKKDVMTPVDAEGNMVGVDIPAAKPESGGYSYDLNPSKAGAGRGMKKGGKVNSKARGLAKDKAPVKKYARGGGVESRGKTKGRFV